MVNAYKVRTYDEDIVGVKTQGSKCCSEFSLLVSVTSTES